MVEDDVATTKALARGIRKSVKQGLEQLTDATLIDRFGQSGDLPDLYRTDRVDPEAVFDAAAELILAR